MMAKRIGVKWYGDKVAGLTEEAARRGLRMAAEYLLEESNRVIPHDEGMLMRSGEVDVDEKKLQASISYDMPYAVKQHEDQTLKHPNGRVAKFLENTVNARGAAAMQHIANELKRNLGG